MKRGYIVLLTTAVCMSCLLLYGQSGKRTSHRAGAREKNVPELYVPTDTINVDMSLHRPPVFVVEGKKTRIGVGVPDAVRMWLVNEISFCISYRPTKRSAAILLEGVKVELYLYAQGSARDNASFRWLCGVQTLHCLIADPEQKMRRYWASLFLPASYVYLHMPQERGKYSLRFLEGVVIIADRDNNILGRRAFGYKSKLSASRAKRLIAAVMELRGKKSRNQVALWPRENTPWAWLDADRFELPFTPLGDGKTEPGSLSAPPQLPAGDSENGNRNEE